MDKSPLCSDEIYFTEKNRANYETSLFCLADFDGANVKKNDRGEKLYKDYLDGRFDAITSIEW